MELGALKKCSPTLLFHVLENSSQESLRELLQVRGLTHIREQLGSGHSAAHDETSQCHNKNGSGTRSPHSRSQCFCSIHHMTADLTGEK